MRSWIVLLVAGAGCAYETHSPEEPLRETEPVAEPAPEVTASWHGEAAVAAAVEAWRWRFETYRDVSSPDVPSCDRRIGGLEVVVVASHDDFRRLCHRCDLTDDSPHCDALGRVNACAPWGDPRDDDGRIGRPHALVVLDATRAADPVTRDRLVVHETIHHIGHCTRQGADASHENSAWWCRDPGCIQGHAEGLLGIR